MKSRASLLLSMTVLLCACGKREQPPVKPPDEGANPISVVYHGSYYDADGKELIDLPQATIDEFLKRRNEELARAVPSPERRAPPTPPSTYIADCIRAKVPIPPPWGDTRWKQQQPDLPANRNFAGPSGDTTQVWTYSDQFGICFALPRLTAGSIRALGIICQSKETGKACFWDNIRKSNATKIVGADTVGMKVQDMQDGSQLDQNCTECHRGDNAFIIHVDTSLAVKPPLDPNPVDDAKPYEPLSGDPSRAGWGNPPSTLGLEGSQCDRCHIMPELTAAYCETVLKPSIGVTMPPNDDSPPPPPTVQGVWDPEFKDDVTKLSQRCRALGVDMGSLP